MVTGYLNRTKTSDFFDLEKSNINISCNSLILAIARVETINKPHEENIMSEEPIKLQRRKFLRILTIGSAMVPLSGLFLRNPALAQEKKLEEDEQLAKSLNYRHDATEVKSDKRGDDEFCYNCQLIQSDEGEWRPCLAFANRLVNENGWCAAYVRKV